MSRYNEDAKYAKEKLNQISPSACLAKWFQTSIHLTTGHTNSCYHPPLTKIDPELVKTHPWMLHYTKDKLEQQKQMLLGERPSGCSYCWKIEDQGNVSDRHYRSGEPWAMDNFDKVNSSMLFSSNTEVAFPNPTYVEVNFNSACNLKCSYCSPQFSSSWMAETKKYGAWPTTVPHNNPKHFEGERRPIPQREYNPYREAFWQWWPDLYKDLKHFRMTGGEPLMDPNTYKVFDYILENPKPDLHLNITSNFSVEPEIFNKFMDYAKRICDGENVEHMMMFVSLDCFGDRAEYIRNGLDFNRLWDNVNRFLHEIPHRNSLTFIITMNNLCIGSLRDLFTAIYGLRQLYSDDYQRVWFDTPMLTTPSWMSLQTMPESYQYQMEKLINYLSANPEEACEGFEGFKDYEVAKLQRVLDWMKQPLTEDVLKKNKKDFYMFFSEHDKRRNTNFLETFPEMADWWSECEYWSKK